MKHQPILTQDRPVLDEASFQQLLAAAFVLQQQHETVIPPEVQTNYSQTLAYIAETQNQIQTRQLDLPAATLLIGEQVEKITNAGGVAVGIVKEDQLVYWACTGSAASEMGSSVPIASSLSAFCLHSGQILQCLDAKRDPRLRHELCQLRGVESLIAVPVYHEGKISGVLELRFEQTNSFREHEVRCSQLMAGLVSDAIARAADLEWKQSLATERASMLEALERIKPQLERLTEPPPIPVPEETVVEGNTEAEQAAAESCRGCGRQFGKEEYFCGTCGTARQEISSRGDIQSKWASLWHMQQAQKNKTDNSFESKIAAADATRVATTAAPPQNLDPSKKDVATTPTPSVIVPNVPDALPAHKSPWTSAARARRWLEELNAQQKPRRAWIAARWHTYRASVYVVVAAFLLLFAILDWGFGPSPTGTSAASAPSTLNARHRPKKPELTLFEKLLVGLGVAEPPPSPNYAGNPQTQVWVDLHTALYYCPGADLYGKTEGGKLTTQQDAQQDQFEPASRKACD